MSRSNLPVNLSPEAWDDLEDVALYSELTWGEEQRARYMLAIDQGLLRLGNFPQLGRKRSELGPHLERHVVIYEVLPAEVYVIRVLYQGRDLRRALQE